MNQVELIPFVIGVTGHRDPRPEALEGMKERFVSVLQWVHDSARDTPVVVLSGLAAGSDQHAIRWALEWAKERRLAGGFPLLRVGVVLPFSRREFLVDFMADEEARRGFEELERQASFQIALPETPHPHGENRDQHYERLGNFLADRCQLLVAFWNGLDNHKRGGTAHVVRMCEAAGHVSSPEVVVPFREGRHILSRHDATPVEVIPTPRQSDASGTAPIPANPGITCATRPRHRRSLFARASSEHAAGAHDPSGSQALIDYLGELNEINRITIRCRERLRIQDERSPLVEGAESAWNRFLTADAVAVRRKNLFRWNVIGLSVLTIVAVGFFQWFGTHDKQFWAAWMYLALMAVSVLWYIRLRFHSKIEWLFVHARGVAEALRVQIAWTAAGVPDVVTDHYMSRRGHDTQFLRRLVRAAAIEIFVDAAADRPAIVRAAAGREWVAGQIRYMRRQTAESARTLRSRLLRHSISALRRLMKAWWILILLISLVLAFVSTRHAIEGEGHRFAADAAQATPVEPRDGAGQHGGPMAWLPFGVFVVGSLLFLKVGIEYHDGAIQAEEDSEAYERLLPVFERADALLAREPDQSEGKRILRALGKEALDEQAEWFVKHLYSLRMPNVG